MKQKRLVMLALGAALIGGYFFLARRASAATVNGAGGGTGGVLGAVPFSDSPSGLPLSFEGGAGGVNIRPETGAKGLPGRFSPKPLPSAPVQPSQPATPRRLAPQPGAQPKLATVRRAQGVTPIPKAGVRRFLD